MALKGFSSESGVLRWLTVPHNTITPVFHNLFKNQPNNRESTDIRNRVCSRYCSGFIVFFITFKESSESLTLKGKISLYPSIF